LAALSCRNAVKPI